MIKKGLKIHVMISIRTVFTRVGALNTEPNKVTIPWYTFHTLFCPICACEAILSITSFVVLACLKENRIHSIVENSDVLTIRTLGAVIESS